MSIQAWEYKFIAWAYLCRMKFELKDRVVQIDFDPADSAEVEANRMGAKGWELAAVTHVNGGWLDAVLSQSALGAHAS